MTSLHNKVVSKETHDNVRQSLAIVVVEAHHHALEHVHNVLRRIISIRRRRNLDNGGSVSWTLVNFDSHPDMACMRSIPASATFNPRRPFSTDIRASNESLQSQNFYEMLDTCASGIAEWIIPLVLAANLHTIFWVRSSWASQFEDGQYDFAVGAWAEDITEKVSSYLDLPDSARVKVSLAHPYYIEDSSVVPEDELQLRQQLCFIVSQNLAHPIDDSSNNMNLEGNMWCLSVDLDYFSCLNPFISDLEVIDKPFTISLMKAANETQFRQKLAMPFTPEMSGWYETEYHRFIHLVTLLFEDVISMPEFILGESTTTEPSKEILFRTQRAQAFAQMYENPDYGIQLWNDVIDNLLLIPMFQCSSHVRKQVASSVIQALPCLFLPHHPESCSECEYQRRIQFMGDSIRQSKLSQRPPFMVAISRSAIDGFTPAHLVNTLQDAVLREIHSIFCGCCRDFESASSYSESKIDLCRCLIVLDYGEQEGSQIDTSRMSFYET